MTERHATFFICDDLLVALNGKFTVAGMYTGDVIIPADETKLSQLVIFVEAETPIEKPFRSLNVLVQFPGEEAKVLNASALLPVPMQVSGRTAIKVRVPFLIPQPVLRPGPIEVKIVHEDGVLFAGKQWI